VLSEIRYSIDAVLQNNLKNAMDELESLLDDERRHPITYNHYYTDNIQKSRQQRLHKSVEKAIQGAMDDNGGKLHVSNTSFDHEKLFDSLNNRIIVDMDEQACSEALEDLEAYYKVCQTC
jgi:hypothetical protein